MKPRLDDIYICPGSANRNRLYSTKPDEDDSNFVFNFSDSHSEFLGDFGNGKFQGDLADLFSPQNMDGNVSPMGDGDFRTPNFFGMGFSEPEEYFKKEIKADQNQSKLVWLNSLGSPPQLEASPENHKDLREEIKEQLQESEVNFETVKPESPSDQEVVNPSPAKKPKKKKRSSRSKNLALRADVMNKNVFRAFRRECKIVFQNFLLSNGFTLSRSKRIFRANLRRFSAHLLDQANAVLQASPGLDTDEFMKFVGVFINLCSMKKIFTSSRDLGKIESFNELLYSYSHKKFYDFLTIPEVSVLLRVVLEQEGVEGFIRRHNTLAVNQKAYVAHITELLKDI